MPLAERCGIFALYLLVAALSLPGAAVMTLAAGLLFGLWQGTLLVSLPPAPAQRWPFGLALSAARYAATPAGRASGHAQPGLERDGAFTCLPCAWCR
ncbi:hypothetical protein O0544_22340 [Edwardsiella anguillarum]|nr:hypothetical protein [Edwardsiella anguillarum]